MQTQANDMLHFGIGEGVKARDPHLYQALIVFIPPTPMTVRIATTYK
jgi:hypothetical protein